MRKEDNVTTIRPERIKTAVEEINEFVKKYPTATFMNFLQMFKRTKAWTGLKKVEKKLIFKDKDVLDALQPILQNNNLSLQDVDNIIIKEEETMNIDENKNGANGAQGADINNSEVDDDTAASNLIKTTKDDGNSEQDITEFMQSEIKAAGGTEENKDDKKDVVEAAPTATAKKDTVYLVTRNKTVTLGEVVEVELTLGNEKKELSMDAMKKMIPDFSEPFYASLKKMLRDQKPLIAKILEITLMDDDDNVPDSLDDTTAKALGFVTLIGGIAMKTNVSVELACQYIDLIAIELDVDTSKVKFERVWTKAIAGDKPIVEFKRYEEPKDAQEIFMSGLDERRKLLGIA
jgi:hypothetical protein